MLHILEISVPNEDDGFNEAQAALIALSISLPSDAQKAQDFLNSDDCDSSNDFDSTSKAMEILKQSILATIKTACLPYGFTTFTFFDEAEQCWSLACDHPIFGYSFITIEDDTEY